MRIPKLASEPPRRNPRRKTPVRVPDPGNFLAAQGFSPYFRTLVMTTFQARSVSEPEARSAPSLDRLSLHNYRNFERLECEFPAPGVAIVGPNGSGKTNLLEAIYYLEVFRSFRGAPDRQLVRFGAQVFRLEGSQTHGGASVAAAYDRSRRLKKVEREGREVDRVSEAIGALGVVVFRLEDVEILREGPCARRRFLDMALSVADSAYLAALQRYRASLARRNEALRRGASRDEIDAWSEGLVQAGARITTLRARWVAEGAARYAEHYERISGGDAAGLAYASSIAARDAGDSDEDAGGQGDGSPHAGPGDPTSDAARWAERFRSALRATAERERRRGLTVVGPHRDDLTLTLGVGDARRDLRRYGSSGQQRTAVLALRLLEADRLHERLGREPLYLLDDVFAELDDGRSERLLELFESGRGGQAILTAPKVGDIRLRDGELPRWRMHGGRLLS